MIRVKALWRSSTLDMKLNIKAYTWKACLPSSSVFCVHKHTFWKGLWIRKGFFLLSVLKINFYMHIKSTKTSSDISKTSSSILIHFLIWFIIETEHRLRIQHWTLKKPKFTSALHHSACTEALLQHHSKTLWIPTFSKFRGILVKDNYKRSKERN